MTLSHERFRFSGQASAAKRRDRSWYPKHHKSDPGNMPRCDCFPQEATCKTDIKTPASPPLIFEDPEYQSQTPRTVGNKHGCAGIFHGAEPNSKTGTQCEHQRHRAPSTHAG